MKCRWICTAWEMPASHSLFSQLFKTVFLIRYALLGPWARERLSPPPVPQEPGPPLPLAQPPPTLWQSTSKTRHGPLDTRMQEMGPRYGIFGSSGVAVGQILRSQASLVPAYSSSSPNLSNHYRLALPRYTRRMSTAIGSPPPRQISVLLPLSCSMLAVGQPIPQLISQVPILIIHLPAAAIMML